MSSSSLKTNIFLNYLNTITGLIFPVVTFPYASRILLPEGIGIVNFLNSIINYIILLTSLGIPLYAVKEVAKYRDNLSLRNKTTIEIIILSLSLSLFGYIAVYLIARYVPQVEANKGLFFVLSSAILFNSLGVNWFYQAIEDFKYITIRAILVRSLAACSLFLFVKDSSDLLVYGLVVVGTSVGNNLVNFIHLRKYISFSSVRVYKLHILSHLKPALHIFVLNLIISIYAQLNTVMLGFMADEYAVGIYTAGNKLPHMFLSVVTSLGAVMLPRCSNLVSTGKLDEFARVSDRAVRLILTLSLPFVALLTILAQPIIEIFCGHSFLESVPVVYWTAPIVVFIGLTNVIGIQMLYPLGKENIVIYSTLGGAVANLLLNVVLIPRYQAVGAAVSTFFAELVVLLIQMIVGRKYIPVKLFSRYNMRYLGALGLMCVVIIPYVCIVKNMWLQIIGTFFLGGITYAGVLIAYKDDIVIEIKKYIFKR